MSENDQQSRAPKLSNPQILENKLETALRQIKRPAGGLFLGGISGWVEFKFWGPVYGHGVNFLNGVFFSA